MKLREYLSLSTDKMKTTFPLLLILPALSFGFSEIELESLERSGSKSFSKNRWRRDIGFSLIRNLDIETRHKSLSEQKGNNTNKFCDTKAEGSLCDLSNLYYNLDFTLYYSLIQWAENRFDSSFLKDAELFLGGFFRSNFRGGNCSELEGYDNFKSYIGCGLGDLVGGGAMPIYKKNNFFSYFNFSTILWPLSKKSRNTSLKTAFNTSISMLYFIKKENKWSGTLSSKHSLTYNHFRYHKAYKSSFTQLEPDQDKGHTYNNPFDSSQQLNLIFKQNFNKYLPANTGLFITYSFTINTQYSSWSLYEIEQKSNKYWNDVGSEHRNILKNITKGKCPKSHLVSVIVCGNRYQQLALGFSFSWKLKQRVYLRLSAKWKDLIKVHSPFNKYFDIDKKIGQNSPPGFGLDKWYFTLRTSFSF